MTAVPAPGIGTHVTTHYEQFRPYPHLPLQVLSVAVRRRLNRRIPSRDRRVLAAALHLLDHGTDALFGYELFACMLAGAGRHHRRPRGRPAAAPSGGRRQAREQSGEPGAARRAVRKGQGIVCLGPGLMAPGHAKA